MAIRRRRPLETADTGREYHHPPPPTSGVAFTFPIFLSIFNPKRENNSGSIRKAQRLLVEGWRNIQPQSWGALGRLKMMKEVLAVCFGIGPRGPTGGRRSQGEWQRGNTLTFLFAGCRLLGVSCASYPFEGMFKLVGIFLKL